MSGVGGWTIEEAKARMTFAEAQQWLSFIQRRGPMDMGARMETGFALLATMINHANGGKAKMRDFMPYAPTLNEPAADAPEATPEDVFALFQSLAKGKPTK